MRKIIIFILCLFFVTSTARTETVQNTVYFDEQALDPILQLIDKAQSSIYIEMYNFTNTHEDNQQNSDVIQCLLNKLTEKPDKNIDLKIIIDGQEAVNRPPEQNGKPTGFPESLFEKLLPDCIKWDNQSGKMHRKVAVVDGTEVFIGSTNWTNNGFNKNREIDVLLHDPVIAKQIIDEFYKDWNTASLDYPSKAKPPEQPEPPENEEYYIGNSSTMKFHRPTCKYIDNIKEEHTVTFTTRQESIDQKYSPCGACKP
ncbi:MAG: hypothetical protein HGA95_02175 [Caldiserica bacterium]|nr:hypothetical protein [Caldisericota bacterium]